MSMTRTHATDPGQDALPEGPATAATSPSFCRVCVASCPVEMETKDRRIVDILPNDPANPVYQGCFHSGPFAWDGVVAFWIPVSTFFGWLLATVWLLIAAVADEEREYFSALG
jgi:hypothetical protein